MNQIIYATTNIGKFREVEKIFSHHHLKLQSLIDYNIDIDAEESGNTLEENALIKAQAYAKLLPSDAIVIADDTGIEIDALGGAPGIKVRRWKGYKMTDEEIISHCLTELQGVSKVDRGAQFRTVLAVVSGDQAPEYFEGILRGEILSVAQPKREPGMPFWPLFYLPKLGLSLGEFHAKSMDFQLDHPTHRELAVLCALPYLSAQAGLATLVS